MKKYLMKFVVLTGLALLTALVLIPTEQVEAMPNFARQLGTTCSHCHTIVPRLNRTGYEFRRAGFRMPDEIGEVREFEKDRDEMNYTPGNYASARLQMNISHKSTDDGSGGPTSKRTQIAFKEFTLYPLTGGFMGNWAAESEISGATDELEVENGYLRYVTGDDQTYWQVRGGLFHPFEGFGASDRPLGLSRPLIQSQGTTNSNGDYNGWHPWGFDQTGVEAGVAHQNTSISFTVLNGIMENADDPAQGGGLSKAAGSPTENSVDFQVFANQFIGETNAAVSAYYYNGRISLDNGSSSVDLMQNDFQRYAVYVTVPLNTAQLLGAYSGGSDTYTATDVSINNSGLFVELDNYFSERFGSGIRYDSFDPSDISDNDISSAVSVFANAPLNNGVQFIVEYKYMKTEMGANPDKTTNSLNLRSIYIF